MVSILGELYSKQLNWASIGWGDFNKENQNQLENAWKMYHEEMNELKNAEEDIDILDAIADIFVVNSQLCQFYVLNEHDFDFAELLARSEICKSKFFVKYGILINENKFKPDENITHKLFGYWARMADHYENLGWDIEGAIREVTDSNYSKFPYVDELFSKYDSEEVISEEELLKLESKWIEENSDYKDVVGHVSKGRVVFKCNNGLGKVVKPSTYFKPELSKFLGND